jgi:hypothetical protein
LNKHNKTVNFVIKFLEPAQHLHIYDTSHKNTRRSPLHDAFPELTPSNDIPSINCRKYTDNVLQNKFKELT